MAEMPILQSLTDTAAETAQVINLTTQIVPNTTGAFTSRLRLVQGRQVDSLAVPASMSANPCANPSANPPANPVANLDVSPPLLGTANVIDLTIPSSSPKLSPPLESPVQSLLDSLRTDAVAAPSGVKAPAHLKVDSSAPQAVNTPLQLPDSVPSLWHAEHAMVKATANQDRKPTDDRPATWVETLKSTDRPAIRRTAITGAPESAYVDIRSPRALETRTDSGATYDFTSSDEQWSIGPKHHRVVPFLLGFVAINAVVLTIAWAAWNRPKDPVIPAKQTKPVSRPVDGPVNGPVNRPVNTANGKTSSEPAKPAISGALKKPSEATSTARVDSSSSELDAAEFFSDGVAPIDNSFIETAPLQTKVVESQVVESPQPEDLVDFTTGAEFIG
jgi:hypothetical protein